MGRLQGTNSPSNGSRAHTPMLTPLPQFWKQFFEASANVSLNGYEETPTEADTTTTSAPTDATLTDDGDDGSQATPYSSSYASPPQTHDDIDFSTPKQPSAADETDLSTTPRPARGKQRHQPARRDLEPPSTMTAPYDSPYEKLRREMLPHPTDADTTTASSSYAAATASDEPGSTLPRTPRAQTLPYTPSASTSAVDYDGSSVPDSPALALPSARRLPGGGGLGSLHGGSDARTGNADMLLHRVLDRNYRLQATPHAQPPRPLRPTAATRTPPTGRRTGRAALMDLDSSPLEEAPQLRSEMLESPARKRGLVRGAAGGEDRPRVPGVSVLTPARKGPQDMRRREWEDDDDDDEDDDGLPEGMSPPKTMQFHVPQSRLLKTPGEQYALSVFPSLLLLMRGFACPGAPTGLIFYCPAREASKRIVEDLLLTAGGTFASDDEGRDGGGAPPDSPSIIGRRAMLEEDTF